MEKYFVPLGIQNLPEIALSLTVFEINDILHFCQNSRLWKKIGKIKNVQTVSGVVLSTLRV